MSTAAAPARTGARAAPGWSLRDQPALIKLLSVAALRTVAIVKRLPKTRSGKILRSTLARIADGEAYAVPATIDDPAILDEIADVLATRRPSADSARRT